VQGQFYEKVVQSFIRQYLAGKTPNPCLFCNPQVKWGILQTYALEQGADFFATGHYARIEVLASGQVRLNRGADRSKDQSYVLSMLSQFQLSHTLLPLGVMKKTDVRAQARQLNLPVADRQDSQDLCFLGDVNYRDFLERFAPGSAEPGEIVDMQGNALGEHHGLAFYTIGQRKGIRIAALEPYYVVGKDTDHNRLVVGFSHQVGKNVLNTTQANWIAGAPPPVGEEYDVMIRYRANPVPAKLTCVDETDFRLEFNEKVRGITPGQAAVLYRDEECLGGGIIQSSG
jgi:tRNA-specific 2-thiouridylase